MLKVGADITSCGREFQVLISFSQGQEVQPHNLMCPLFLQSLIAAFRDAAVELDILCIHSIDSSCVFEQVYHVPSSSVEIPMFAKLRRKIEIEITNFPPLFLLQ